jgi:hypothetical protein
MSLSRADSVENGVFDRINRRLIGNLDKPRRRNVNGRISLQTIDDLVRCFTSTFGNPFCEQFGTACDRHHRDATAQGLRLANHAARDIDDGGRTIAHGRKACKRNSVEKPMRAPAQSKVASRALRLKACNIQRVVILRIGLRGAGDHAAWKDKLRLFGKRLAHHADDRVFAAARRTDNQNKSALGMLA